LCFWVQFMYAKNLIKMRVQNTSVIFVVCIAFALFVVSNLNADWVQQTSGTTNPVWNARFPTSSCGWAVVRGVDSVLHTTNSGQTWYWQGLTPYSYIDFRCMSFLDTSRGWLAGSSTVMRTTNGGITWDTAAPGGPPLGISFVDSSTGWISGWNGFLAKTRNGGRTWAWENSGASSQLFSICFVDSLFGWTVGGIENSTDTGSCIRSSTNGGASWTMQYPPNYSVLYSVWFVDRMHGWSVGGFGRGGGDIISTTDGGSNWIRQYASTITSFLGVHFYDLMHGWAVGSGGSIFATTDGGATWVQQTTPTTYDLRGVWFVDSLRGWAVGDWGTILYTENGGFSAVEENKQEDSNLGRSTSSLALSIIPNPAHKFVSFKITSGRTFRDINEYEISVFNVTGKKVWERGPAPGGNCEQNVVVWPLTSKQGKRISNGVYFVRARKGINSTLKKLIVCN